MLQKWKSVNGRLARRMGMYVILASTCVTVFTSGFQMYTEFLRDVNEVESTLLQIEKTHLSNIASRLWVLDTDELETTLNSLASLPFIKYLAVYENDTLLRTAGVEIKRNVVIKNYPIIYKSNDKVNQIGRLTVQASLDEAYQHIIDHGIIILGSNAIKTFIIAILILLIFYQLIARHLHKIAEFAENLDATTLGQSFTLDRKHSEANVQDELDLVSAALVKMQNNLATTLGSLRQREQDLSITLNSIGDAVIATDASGRVMRMNPVAEKLTGWSFKEAQGMSLHKIFPIVDATARTLIENPVERVISTGETIFLSNHTTLIARDGIEYHIADSAAPIRNSDNEIVGVVLVFNDVSEQYKLREIAAKSKRDLQAILDHAPSVIYVKGIDGRYVFVNKKFEKLFHVTTYEIRGKTDYDIFPTEFADTFQNNDAAVLAAGRAVEFEEQAPDLKSGYRSYFSVKFPLQDENKNIYAICGISTDITDRKQQDDLLRRSQKMEALGNLTGGIAHDYNNMLGVVMGYAELLEAEVREQPKLVMYATEIRRAGERGAKLTKSLLSFSKQKISAPVRLYLNDLVNTEKHMLEKTLTARIELILDFDDKLWPVKIDSGDMQDAILNLCINAMHAMDGSGKLTIKTHNKTITQRDDGFSQLPPGDYVLISVTDTGCGMSWQVKEKIFDPFYSTKGDKGTGLGLSQVYGFVERSDGIINVYTEENEGTQFTLVFPRFSEMAVDNNAVGRKKKKCVAGTETILLVDDEPALLSLATEILLMQGYTVFSAENAEKALEILERESIDLMLSDIIMPGMDGYQLTSVVLKRFPNVKIQLVSGFNDNRHAGMINDKLHETLLHKPYNSRSLLNRIRDLLDS